MKFCFYTNTISPHQLPLARSLVARLGVENYRYIYLDELTPERTRLGWGKIDEPWILPYGGEEARRWLEDADVVMMQHPRDWDLFVRRLSKGMRCIYISERWFKPPAGMLRLAYPGYFRMAREFVREIMQSPHFLYFPDGIHAARDMAMLCGFINGDFRCLFRAPELECEKKPGGRFSIATKGVNGKKKYCLDKMRMWGYFVEDGTGARREKKELASPRVLWVGRLLNLKRVDTIVRAVGEAARFRRIDASLAEISLDVYGAGPEEERLKKMAARYDGRVHFHPPVPIGEVRRLMRSHDIYVLSSNAFEGWGAVVNEAVEEGMRVIGTFEAGSSATMLPASNLFHAGDWRSLARLLANPAKLADVDRDIWSVASAADALLGLCGGSR